jgi:hypothetical protein
MTTPVNMGEQMSKEIDAQIAEMVMGWTWCPGEGQSGCDDSWMLYNSDGEGIDEYPAGWSPSTDIAAAFEVVDKIVGDQYRYVFRLEQLTGRMAPGRWWAYFDKDAEQFAGHGETAPLAICKAALAALSSVAVEAGEK